jgi:hypothetical protein
MLSKPDFFVVKLIYQIPSIENFIVKTSYYYQFYNVYI